jgi:hypothetical protein
MIRIIAKPPILRGMGIDNGFVVIIMGVAAASTKG